MKIYVASSWRNPDQPTIVTRLRSRGHDVYDFRHPTPGNHGFHWSEIDSSWRNWDVKQYRRGLQHPLAADGFTTDYKAMEWADACVLVLPCGRSAHLEAGWFCGQGKPVYAVLGHSIEPELMYILFNTVVRVVEELEKLLEQEP